MSRIKNYLYLYYCIFADFPIRLCAESLVCWCKPQTVVKQNAAQTSQQDATKQIKIPLVITPQEINLGIISPDRSGEATVTLKNTGSGVITWSTEGPEGGKNLNNKNYPVHWKTKQILCGWKFSYCLKNIIP